jgi:hypothetical protein
MTVRAAMFTLLTPIYSCAEFAGFMPYQCENSTGSPKAPIVAGVRLVGLHGGGPGGPHHLLLYSNR